MANERVVFTSPSGLLTNFGSKELAKALLHPVLAYCEGSPVVVLDENSAVLHGEQTLKTIIDIGCAQKALIISGIDGNEFEATDWPEFLEAGRRNFMAGKPANAGFICWVKQSMATLAAWLALESTSLRSMSEQQ